MRIVCLCEAARNTLSATRHCSAASHASQTDALPSPEMLLESEAGRCLGPHVHGWLSVG